MGLVAWNKDDDDNKIKVTCTGMAVLARLLQVRLDARQVRGSGRSHEMSVRKHSVRVAGCRGNRRRVRPRSTGGKHRPSVCRAERCYCSCRCFVRWSGCPRSSCHAGGVRWRGSVRWAAVWRWTAWSNNSSATARWQHNEAGRGWSWRVSVVRRTQQTGGQASIIEQRSVIDDAWCYSSTAVFRRY